MRIGDRSDDADAEGCPEDMPDLTDVKKATDCNGDRCELPEEKSYLF